MVLILFGLFSLPYTLICEDVLFGSQDDSCIIMAQKLEVARNLREKQSYSAARLILKPLKNRPITEPDVLILDALLASDQGNIDEAIGAIGLVRTHFPNNAEAAAAAAYLFRINGEAGSAIKEADQALTLEPTHVEARRQRILALADLGGAVRAAELLKGEKDIFSREEEFWIRGKEASALLRYAKLHEHGSGAKTKIEATNNVIGKLIGLIEDPSNPESTILSQRFDLVLAYRQAKRMRDALELHAILVDEGHNLPPFVTTAAADAYLHLGNPKRAIELYTEVLQRDQWNFDVRISLFYALISADRFEDALSHIDRLAEEKPAYVWINGTHRRIAYWNRLHADLVAAMARAYANRPAAAQQQLEALLKDAPGSAWIRQELATVYRWRGWPLRAFKELEISGSLGEMNAYSQLNLASTLIDLGEFEEADKLIHTLYSSHPHNLSVEREYRQWQKRRGWNLHISSGYGDSDGYNEAPQNSALFITRLDAPWISHHYRLHALNHYDFASYPEGAAHFNRLGIGLTYHKLKQHAYLELTDNRSLSLQPGISVSYQYRPTDELGLSTNYESFSKHVPIRALMQGIRGWRAATAFEWRRDESLSVWLSPSLLFLSDGNARWAIQMALNRRLFANALHTTNDRFDLYTSSARQSGGPYFNPQQDFSFHYEIEHNRLTWRQEEKHFMQLISTGIGAYQQDDHWFKPVCHIRYEHRLKWHENWTLQYGIRIASRVYDAHRERHLDGKLTLEGSFR